MEMEVARVLSEVEVQTKVLEKQEDIYSSFSS